MNTRKAITIMVTLIALILIGTVIVLTTVVQYFGVDSRDIITELEMNMYERLALQAKGGGGGTKEVGSEKEQKVVVPPPVEDGQEGLNVVVSKDEKEQSLQEFMNGLEERGWLDSNEEASLVKNLTTSKKTPQPRIPKIIHATWKTDVLPDRWEKIRQGCIDLHPDYEFMLWSDASSRNFIAEYYPWFLSTFDGYTYPIQRADVIRYFVLHRFGGVYMDLDIGCRRNMDPLLYYEVILPQTIPVGVSNDLMFSMKGHPFMDLVIHNLITFDHTYGTNYPTVMFSTGPMFLSAQYGLWPKDVAEGMDRQVRVLPKRWYGKNARPSQMEDSYFDHYYGSSWHAEDAGFITFLGKFGAALMYAGLALVVLGLVRLLWSKRSVLRSSPRILGPIALPQGTPASAHEALPFIRPDTPGGSRPSTPLDRNSSSPNGRSQSNRPGLLYYLPVWVMPHPERSPGGSTSPNAAHNSNWSQYFSNLSFVDPGDHDNRYHPIPNFSRPPSPSNNSILHAPGSTHDGAFDGVALHSIPGSSRPLPSQDNPSTSSSSSNNNSLSSTSGPRSPPAYSTLRNAGAWLFRPSDSTSTSKESESGTSYDHIRPSSSLSRRSIDLEQQQQGYFGESKSTSTSGDRTPGLGFRPRTPTIPISTSNSNSIPPEYSTSFVNGGRRTSIDHQHVVGGTSRTSSRSQSRSTTPTPQSGASTSRITSSTEYGTEFNRSSQVATTEEAARRISRRSSQSNDEFSILDNNDDVVEDEREFGIPLEEEVDRLLNEMSPIDLEKGQRQQQQDR